jgi:general secretion pathway protein D
LILRIRPQISEGGLVKLQIYEESSTVDATTLNNVNGPTYNKRSVDSSVLVQDGQLIVLGGLLSDSYSDSMEKTPWLADIPYLGWMFRYEGKARIKDNLMLFLRPYVIRTAEQSDALTNDRYEWTQGIRNNEPVNIRVLSNETLTPLTSARGSGAPFVDPLHASTIPTAIPLPGSASDARLPASGP